jgi:23S rRNA pseudouridine2605 synthase
MAEERLQRALARAGFGPRRACEDLISAGRVTVNGRVATLGDKVEAGRDRVAVDGTTVNLDPEARYYAFHKPAGVTSSVSDPHARIDLRRFFPAGPRVFAVGRLDRDTEGLLLLTNDGELAHRLLHPSHGVEREYLAEVDGVPNERHAARLRRGVDLEDGRAHALRARPVGRAGGRGAIRVVIAEGRKREVRRMLAAVGLPVRRLVRVRFGPIRLGRLPAAAVRPLSVEEVRALYGAAGL